MFAWSGCSVVQSLVYPRSFNMIFRRLLFHWSCSRPPPPPVRPFLGAVSLTATDCPTGRRTILQCYVSGLAKFSRKWLPYGQVTLDFWGPGVFAWPFSYFTKEMESFFRSRIPGTHYFSCQAANKFPLQIISPCLVAIYLFYPFSQQKYL